MILKENERIDDLQRNGFRIIQDRKMFRFGTDAVLLAHFTEIKKGDRIVDLGTGNGVIPLLLCALYSDITVTGLEIQSSCCDICRRNIVLNGLEDRMKVAEGDINEIQKYFPAGETEVVVTNPPYMKGNGGLKNEGYEKAVSRHEILVNIEGVVKAATYLLKFGGRLYMVHRPERLSEIFEKLKKYSLEPKKIRFVQAKPDKEASMVLIEACKGGKTGLKVMPVLNIADSSGRLTEEYSRIYEDSGKSESDR